MPGNKKNLEEISPLRIIKEVQKWPVLFERDNPDRSNYFRTRLWHEVGKALIVNWNELGDSDKKVKAWQLSMKWRNLRDTYRRSLEAQANGRSTSRRRYVYARHMAFLRPHMRGVSTPSSPPSTPNGTEAQPTSSDRNLHALPRLQSNNLKLRKMETTCIEPKTEHIDEDRHFLLSLIPSFRKMSDDEKLTAKVEILKIIKQVRNNGNVSSATGEFVQEWVGESEGDVKLELLPEGGSDCLSDEDLTES